MQSQLTDTIIYWVPLLVLVAVWIFFIRRMKNGPSYVNEMNAAFTKQNEEIIALLRDIKNSLENRKL
jgi:ATP-dependent Zn protease